MKKLLIMSAMSAMSLSVFANGIPATDYVSGKCISKIKRNKSQFKPLKASEVEHNFKILSHFDSETPKTIDDGRGRINMQHRLVRVMPNMVNAIGDYNELSAKKNQVLLFLDDSESMGEAKALTKDGSLAIDNFGKQPFRNPISVAFTYNGRGQTKSPRIVTSAMAVGGAVDSEILEFKNDKTVEFKIESDVNFQYRNFEYSGFLGLGGGSDKSANERLEQDGWKTHKGKFEMVCSFTLSEPTEAEKKKKKEDAEVQKNNYETLELNKSIGGVQIELNDRRVVRE